MRLEYFLLDESDGCIVVSFCQQLHLQISGESTRGQQLNNPSSRTHTKRISLGGSQEGAKSPRPHCSAPQLPGTRDGLPEGWRVTDERARKHPFDPDIYEFADDAGYLLARYIWPSDARNLRSCFYSHPDEVLAGLSKGLDRPASQPRARSPR